MRPHTAKSYFETFKIYDHMQEIRPISQKFTEILKFENSDITKFCVPWPTEIAAARSPHAISYMPKATFYMPHATS